MLDRFQNGWTPLHFAAKAGHMDVVKLLVESGACPKHETIDNKMPISLAASAGHTDVLSYLLRQDRNTNLLLDDTKVSGQLTSDTQYNSYPRESEGICFHRRWFVCVCVSVCLFVTTITKTIVDGFAPNCMRRFLGGKGRQSSRFVTIGRGMWK